MKAYSTIIIIFFSLSTFSQETKCECYSKSGVKEKTGIGGWTSIIGYNKKGEQLQYHFYAAYFPPQELCIPRDNYWWQEVNAAILKAIKSHPIYKSSQIALATDDPDATPKATNIAGQAFITQQKVYEIERLSGTIVSVDAYLQEKFASKLQLCSNIDNEKPTPTANKDNIQNDSYTQKKNDVTSSKNNQTNDAQNFINNQKAASQRHDAALEELGNNLTQTFDKISSSWAKERDFQSKMSSLTNIRSINASSIISEARSKAQQINVQYSERKRDALNQGITATQTLVNSAKNEKQAIVGAALGTLGTMASQANLEKSRKDAQRKLQNQQERALKKLANVIIKKYSPSNKKYKMALKYAVLETEESYYLSQIEYTGCMIDNAYEIVVNDYSCSKPEATKPSKKSSYTGQQYFNAYKRKSESIDASIKNKAPYFLELAIQSEPKNAEWLYEKTLIKELSVRTKTSILFKAYYADVNNEKIKNAYESELKKLKEIEKIEQAYISRFLTSDKHKNFDWNKNENLYILHRLINNKIKSLALNRKGEVIFRLGDELMLSRHPLTYQYDKFNNGLLKVKMKNDNENYDFGFINSKGKLVIPLKEYHNVHSFFSGFAKIQSLDNKLYSFIDTSGKQIVEFKYSDAKNFSEGFAAIQENDRNDVMTGKYWGFINKKGEEIISCKYFLVSSFSEGLAAVKKLPEKIKSRIYESDILSHYIDIKGNTVISGDFNYAMPFSNGIAVVGNKRNYWYIDKEGNDIFDNTFDMANNFNKDGYALVKKKKYYFFINKNGENETQNKFKGKPIFNILEGKYNPVLNSKNKLVQIDNNGKVIK